MKTRYILLKILFFLAILPLLTIESCAPVFSDLQSARLVGEGNLELTPSYSSVSFGNDGESSSVQNHFGVQAGFGMSEKMDLRARIEYINVSNSNGGESINATVIGVGPKFQLIEDRMAAYIPIGAGFGSNIETSQSWQMQPTLLFTFPISESIEFNPSAKYLIQFAEDAENLVAFNFGLGIGEYGRFVIRPEFGLLYNPGEDGHYSHGSIGISLFPKWNE